LLPLCSTYINLGSGHENLASEQRQQKSCEENKDRAFEYNPLE